MDFTRGHLLVLLALVGFLILIGGAFVESRGGSSPSSWSIFGAETLKALGGTLLASAVIGSIIDRSALRRSMNELGDRVLAATGYGLPPELRKRIEDVTAHPHYFTRVDLDARLDWHDRDRGLIALTASVTSWGVNRGDAPYLPNAPVWFMSSDGNEEETSTYEAWGFEVVSSSPAAVGTAALRTDDPSRILEHVRPNLNGGSSDEPDEHNHYLDQASLILSLAGVEGSSQDPEANRKRVHELAKDDRLVAAAKDQQFRTERRVSFLLDQERFFPFISNIATADLTCNFSGDVLADHKVTLMVTTGGTSQVDADRRHQFRCGARMPGEAVVFSWHRNA